MQSGFQELLGEFLLEAHERADEVESMLLKLASGDAELRHSSIARAKRELHTLKGNSGMMGFGDLQQIAHRMEDQVEELDLEEPQIDDILRELDALRRGLEVAHSSTAELDLAEPEEEAAKRLPEEPEPRETAAASVRVPFAKIDQLVELQAEALIFRNRLSDAIHQGLALLRQDDRNSEEVHQRNAAAWEDVERAQQALEKTLHQLQELVTDLGMVPLQSLFRSLQRVVHDESAREGKQVELVREGGDTPIDKTLLEAAGDALGHLVRNAVIHGIETPAERRRRGKPETGTVRLRATLQSSEVAIEVADDGAGIDIAALKARARELGGVQTDSDLDLLFTEGLSTRLDADLGAGRGVGLTAVKRSVEGHGGRIDIRSQRGAGTSFSLRLPVTTSILRSLLLEVDTEEYALPLTTVVETSVLQASELHRMNRAGVTRWRGRVIPLLDLGLAFGTAKAPRSVGFLVVIDVNGRFRGLAIDRLVGIRDIVVKRLDHIVGRPTGISGSTILSDGRVVMILDSATLATIPPFVDAPQ